MTAAHTNWEGTIAALRDKRDRLREQNAGLLEALKASTEIMHHLHGTVKMMDGEQALEMTFSLQGVIRANRAAIVAAEQEPEA